MNKAIQRLTNILFWSIIAAAFIGPGTVTTAARAGAAYGYSLVWTLVFSTIACIVLQEAAARVRIITGLSLGAALRKRFQGTKRFIWVAILVAGAILLGSAAYETGNILGAVAGTKMLLDLPAWVWVSVTGVAAALLLISGTERAVARFLGVLVAFMGLAFLYTAIASHPSAGKVLRGALVPQIPDAGLSAVLILGLVGTTVVPYNLFLGSGISGEKQKISDMRYGLITAIVLGGIISIAVLIVGSLVEGEFSYENLVSALSTRLGKGAVFVFGLGMLGAGFTSAVTAPLASAITARDLFGTDGDPDWSNKGKWFIFVWSSILLTGLGFGYTGVKPVPAIILAQALNGLILPFISVFLFYIVNQPAIMGAGHLNSRINNILMYLVNSVAWILGLWQVLLVALRMSGIGISDTVNLIPWVILTAFILNTVITYWVMRKRKTA